MVVGGGSAAFVRKRRAALQRWLTLAARHPVMGHDADLRTFLCEPRPKLERPRHDEFELAGTQAHEEVWNFAEKFSEFLHLDHHNLSLLGLGRSFLCNLLLLHTSEVQIGLQRNKCEL